jgi:hypothetical protein
MTDDNNISVFGALDENGNPDGLIYVGVTSKSKRGKRRKYACCHLTHDEARELIRKLERHLKDG